MPAGQGSRWTLAVKTRRRPRGMLSVMNRSREWGSGRAAHRNHRTMNLGGLPSQVAWAERMRDERERKRLEAERLRIARELHDVVAYGFAAISLQAGTAAHLMEQRPELVGEALEAIKTVSRQALAELRGILGMLRDAEGACRAQPGIQELDELADMTTKAGIPTSVRVFGSESELPVEVDSAVYRIVQESLANVLRHARATSALISITFAGDHLLISVEDDGDGVGEPRRQESLGSGYGIVGMRERVLSLGGSLDAGPRAEIGFRVCARLPLAEAA
jgi:signal transduction histidine kinase